MRIERMNDGFVKYHDVGLLHVFTQPDHGPHHDHPWSFDSEVILGGYVEEVLDPATGQVRPVTRLAGDKFHVEATHAHRIVRLIGGSCATIVEPGPWERVSGFWRDGVWRAWDEA